MICCGPFVTKLAKRLGVLTDEVLDGLSAPIYYRQLDDITLKELIGSNGRLIPDDPQLGVPRGVFDTSSLVCGTMVFHCREIMAPRGVFEEAHPDWYQVVVVAAVTEFDLGDV
ncbi:hypothetical protein Tco_0908199 [Tanacetum coccineum]|uniref:Uncharacterized protein n=1 Tax=Tanacetum coccineum TaxID=301880 RepID=A0ABQ5CSZ0_9ASTR